MERGVVPPILRIRQQIRHGEQLTSLVVQQQVVVAEVRFRDMPVEVLGLQIQGEDVRKRGGQGGGDVSRRVRPENAWRS
jgi:hypothetical protein